MSILDEISDEVRAEIDRAVRKFPTWPTDPFHALTVLGEEKGELDKAVLQFVYEPHKNVTPDDIRSEAVQTIAMAIRWLISFESNQYDWTVGPQHCQTLETLPTDADGFDLPF